jgi:hypothetical protein
MDLYLVGSIAAFALAAGMCAAGKGLLPLSTRKNQAEVFETHGPRIFRQGLFVAVLGVLQLIMYLRS